MASLIKPPVILAGLDSLQGLQTARVFAQRQVPVIGLAADPRHFCCRTNACHSVRFVDIRSEKLVADLEQIGPSFKSRPVLIPCVDEAVLLVSHHRQMLEKWYRFSLPDQEMVEIATDKSQFYRFAESHGFPVPKSFVVRNPDDLLNASMQLTFPCVLKPRGRSHAWKNHSALKAFKVESQSRLQQLYEVCRSWCDVLVLQEWIPGSDAELYTCNAYFDTQSRPQATFVSHKLRQWPPEVGGEGCLSEECRKDEVLHESLRLFSLMGLRGLGYLEMKHDPRSGRYIIIEPNIGRPTGRSTLAEAGGVEMLYTMYCDLLGWPLPEDRIQKYTGVKWIHLVRDVASSMHYWRRGQLRPFDWLQSLRGDKVYAVFSLKDPGPFCGDVMRAFRMLLSPSERIRRKPDQQPTNIWGKSEKLTRQGVECYEISSQSEVS